MRQGRPPLGLLVPAVAAVALSVVLGVPLAWMLARVRFPGRPLVRALVTLPMVLPPVVGGVAL
ncbi:MAG: molybdate transport system permease protein, partial [Chloroflexota bacterium]|nr:molybdate transport system permease protein [Chloroflexota bacterium]